MKILFVSDIHLGSPLFKLENELRDLINDKSYDYIYILGDVIDSWEAFIWDIVHNHLDLIADINNNGYKTVILRGNHDPDKTDLKLIFPKCKIYDDYEILLNNGAKLKMVHGHEFDETAEDWFFRFLFVFHWIGQRFGLNLKAWLRKRIYKKEAKRQGVPVEDVVLPAEQKLIEKYCEDYDALICGHGHEDKVVEKDGFFYINIGSLVYKPTYYEYDGDSFVRREL